MKVKVMPIVICALRIIPKELVNGQEDLEISGKMKTV